MDKTIYSLTSPSKELKSTDNFKWEQHDSRQQLKDKIKRKPDDFKRQQQKPHNGKNEEERQRQRPAEDQKNTPKN